MTDFQGSSESMLRMKECGEYVNYTATRDTLCLSFLMSLLLKNSYPVLLTGSKDKEQGISKLGRSLTLGLIIFKWKLIIN